MNYWLSMIRCAKRSFGHQDAKIIKKTAIENGMMTLRESALMKAIEGHTSIEEALQKTQTDRLDN